MACRQHLLKAFCFVVLPIVALARCKSREYEIANLNDKQWISSSAAPDVPVSVLVPDPPNKKEKWDIEKECGTPLWSFFLTFGGTKYYVSYNDRNNNVTLRPISSDGHYGRKFYALLQPDGRVFLLAANSTDRFVVLDSDVLAMNTTDYPHNNSRWLIRESVSDLIKQSNTYFVEIIDASSPKQWISVSANDGNNIEATQTNEQQNWTAGMTSENLITFMAYDHIHSAKLYASTALPRKKDVVFESASSRPFSRNFQLKSARNVNGFSYFIETVDGKYLKLDDDKLVLHSSKRHATAWKLETIGFYHSEDNFFPWPEVNCNDEEDACGPRSKIKSGFVSTSEGEYFCFRVPWM